MPHIAAGKYRDVGHIYAVYTEDRFVWIRQIVL
jgi:hypothetical protein